MSLQAGNPHSSRVVNAVYLALAIVVQFREESWMQRVIEQEAEQSDLRTGCRRLIIRVAGCQVIRLIVACYFGDVDPSDILNANSISNPAVITAGVSLQIP